jgi:hypothetical protein
MDREIKARREYAKKFAFMSKPETNRFYNQSFLSSKVDEMVPEGIMKSSELAVSLNLVLIRSKHGDGGDIEQRWRVVFRIKGDV